MNAVLNSRRKLPTERAVNKVKNLGAEPLELIGEGYIRNTKGTGHIWWHHIYIPLASVTIRLSPAEE